MIKNILVPTDFSKLSLEALRFAVQIAKVTHAHIHLTHILETPSAGSLNVMGQGETVEEVTEEAIFTKLLLDKVRKKLDELAHKYRETGVEIKPKIFFDSPLKTIMKRIEHDGVDLIVMGTHGATGFQELLVGSNTEKVVRYSPVPVIAIKSEVGPQDLHKFVLASDFSESLDQVMPFIKEFQELFKAELMLLRINTPNDFHSSRSLHKLMNETAKKHDLMNWTKFVYCDVIEEDGIMYFAEEHHADLIIMPTHGRTGVSRVLGGSISEDVVNHARRPVMTLKLK